MNLKHNIRRLLERQLNIHIFRFLPRGINLFYDIKYAFPRYKLNLVFDVGANVGQSAKIFLTNFPLCYIHCFEPAKCTFRKLQYNLKKWNKQIYTVNTALGSFHGEGKLLLSGTSDNYHLLDNESKLNLKATYNSKHTLTENVNINMLDQYCSNMNIQHINYLKIDTEGGDLEVLKGGVNMLNDSNIDFVQVETSLNVYNKKHISFEIVKEYLESKKYFLFGLYEQTPEWPVKGSYLRRANAVFVSSLMIERYRQNVT